jgi:hypothetical protein
MSDIAKQCPWCRRWALKDNACSYIFACGLTDANIFKLGEGCGRSWCWTCGKKYCSLYYDPLTGIKRSDAKDNHNHCCKSEEGFLQEEYCPGGHSGHCGVRWT